MYKGQIIEYIFFFVSIATVGYVVWHIFAPFLSALALSAILVIICYPLFLFILRFVTRKNRTLAALLTTTIVLLLIVIPLSLASKLLVDEFISFYASVDAAGQLPIDTTLSHLESSLQSIVPGIDINISDQVRQIASWLTGSIGSIFAGTVSVVITLLIGFLGAFYLFRDGERLILWITSMSPLKDEEDKIIIDRLTRSIRSVATGTVLVAIIQGFAATIGFSIFGIDRPILWGTVGVLGALLPGLGTAGIMVPAIAYLIYTGSMASALGLAIWGGVTALTVDNLLSPYLMSRGNNLHPFVVLLSVLGGISVFGPLGFILGPVTISLFLVLIELYSVYAADHELSVKGKKKHRN
jgi:predicted PurR-regulated permease PerM